jgi:hypothetical protein
LRASTCQCNLLVTHTFLLPSRHASTDFHLHPAPHHAGQLLGHKAGNPTGTDTAQRPLLRHTAQHLLLACHSSVRWDLLVALC